MAYDLNYITKTAFTAFEIVEHDCSWKERISDVSHAVDADCVYEPGSRGLIRYSEINYIYIYTCESCKHCRRLPGRFGMLLKTRQAAMSTT